MTQKELFNRLKNEYSYLSDEAINYLIKKINYEKKPPMQHMQQTTFLLRRKKR